MNRSAVNLASVIGGEALLRVANFAAVVVMARLYGAGVLGTYATLLAYVTVATLVADNGLQTVTITDLSGGSGHINRAVSTLYLTKALLLLPVIVFLVVMFRVLHLPPVAWIVAWLVIARQVVQSFGQLQMAILKSLDRMLPIGLIQAAECSFLLLGIFATYRFNWSIAFLLAWLLAGQLLELGLSLGYIGAARVRPNRTAMHDCYALLRRSTPVGLTYGIAAFILRMDLIVLSVLASAETVGRFAAAHIILTFVYVVAWLFGGVLLPDMVRLSASGDGYTRFVERWSAVVFSATIPVSLAVFFTAPFFSPIVYGKGFTDTGRILAVLALAIPFVLNNSLYFHRAIALGETRVFLGTYLGTAIVGLGLSLLCGATLGYMGIAAAIVIREAAMFGAFKVLASRPVLQPAG